MLWKRWLAFETTGYRRVMRIHWEAKQTNDEVLRKAGGRQLPGMLVKRKLQYFGHLMRKTTDNLEKDIITGSIPDSRRRGRPPRAWISDITDWTDLSTKYCRWSGIENVGETLFIVLPKFVTTNRASTTTTTTKHPIDKIRNDTH